MSQFLILPYVEPPRAVINLEYARVKTIRLKDITEGSQLAKCTFRGRGGEIHDLVQRRGGRRDSGQARWAVLEYDFVSAPEAAIVGLVDAVTNTSDFLLRQRRLVNRPIGEHWGMLKPPSYRITQRRAELLRNGFALLRRKSGDARRFKVALQRWATSYERDDPLDSVLDCCSALEALFGARDELRLRLAFSVYFTVPRQRKSLARLTYRMYGLRNDFIHGGKVPAVSEKEQDQHVQLVRTVVLAVVHNKTLPRRAELDQSIIRMFE